MDKVILLRLAHWLMRHTRQREALELCEALEVYLREQGTAVVEDTPRKATATCRGRPRSEHALSNAERQRRYRARRRGGVK
jgi:hypothetical protein